MKNYVEDKKRDREKKLREIRRKKRTRNFILIISVTLFIFIVLLFLRSSFFEVREIIITGEERLSEEEIRNLMDFDKTVNIFFIPASLISERIESNPWVKEVQTKKHFPNKVEMIIIERIPVAQVTFKDKIYLLDDLGFVLSLIELEDEKLPTISDLKINEVKIGKQIEKKELTGALEILKNLSEEIRNKVRIISASDIGELTFYYEEVEILFGEAEDIDKKSSIIKEILKNDEEQLIFIDVRTPSNPVVKKLNP